MPDGVLVGEHFTHSSEELARGASSIHSKLWNINKQKRSKQNLYKKVLLNISIPFLSMLSKKISLTISDTPGSDEAVVEGLDLDNNIQHLAAFVVVLDYRKMKSEAEIALLRSLKQKHQTILNSPERLLFILNHMNAFDEHRAVKMEDSIRPNEAPRFVADYLKDLLQVNISPDQVIPYSAYWALESRICLDDPHHVDDSIMEEAQLIFRNQGQSDTTDGGGNNMAICKTLEKYSNILMIENRLIHLFVDYGHKVIERDIADKAMLIFTNLLSTINSMLVELGVPARNETLLHQKQVIVSVDQIIKDVPNRLTELFMLRTSTLANMSSTWIATTANMTDMVLKYLDAVIFRTYDHVSNAVQKAKNDLIEKLIPKIEQSCNDIVHHHHDIGMLQLQEQWMGLQQELSLIFGNKSLLYSLPKMAELRIPSLSLQETLHCKIHSFQDIDIADIVREDHGCLIQKATGVYCMIFTCEDIATPASLYTVKTLTLKNSMTKSLNGCSKTIETLLTDNLDSFSSSANRELINSIESWWKDEKPK